MALPPIPGSFMVPVFTTSPALRIARSNGQVALFWPDPEDEFDLEAAEIIPAAQWQPITSGIEINDTTKVYTIPDTAQTAMRYFRLRKR